ncbi:UDP-glucosyltransferase [Operophtera brumata]|uniref:UDP-glucosyltransferase n=1 Tax=Operophtera brumata TaxID=104452 RepID=A0A0L7L1M9_OPEBR|nr:UDP-glucosyltransferase [Operophtera brumata]
MARAGLLLLTLLTASYACEAYKILVVFPLPATSHGILGDGLVRHLLNAGHEVTATTVEHENVQKVLKDPTQHFDLVIAEWLYSELCSSLAGIYQAPLIYFSSVEPHWMILSLVDEYLNPSYNGWDVFEIPPFTFGQRLWELLSTIKTTAVRDTTAPSFEELKYNASLVLGNSHVSMGEATRLPQNYKPIGGYHIEDTFKPLPEDLKKLMDEAKHGVIYFSMGSNLKSKDLPEQLKKDLLKVFGTLKQTVLWKFEEVLPDLPRNVHILKWAPQQSILCSQKVKELSYIYHDRPVKPGVELVHWVEHVIKTGGAPHLRSPALMVPWYQKIYLDLGVLLLIALYILIKVWKIVKPLVFTSLLLLTLLAVSYACDAYKILVVFPLPGTSHGILGDGVVRHLLNAGHEVSYITPFPKKDPHPKLTQIDVSSNMKLIPEGMMNIQSIMDGKVDMDHAVLLFIMNHIAGTTLEHENVQKVIGDQTQHFDLVIVEWILAAIFQAPLIYVSTVEPHWLILSLVDEYLNPSYNGCVVFEVPPFTFGQRLWELLSTIKITAVRDTIVAYLQNREYKRLVAPLIEQRGRTAPSFEELKYNASLVLGNSHVSMGEATRLPQIYKPDLKKLMDEAKHGVIYFSMGSNLKSKDLPEQLKKDFLKVFGTLKQTVLWKFEEVLPDLPKNVHILKWAPQQSILCLLSTTESIHTGTPIIGIPVFADQFINVKRAVNKGFAKQVSLSYTMAGELKEAIEDILTDPKYSQKVKELSYIYHDRPVKPGVELVHWVEHVIKTGGAPHLRSPALMVPWYQKIYLDLGVLLLIALYILIKVWKLVKPLIFRIKVKGDKKKKA